VFVQQPSTPAIVNNAITPNQPVVEIRDSYGNTTEDNFEITLQDTSDDIGTPTDALNGRLYIAGADHSILPSMNAVDGIAAFDKVTYEITQNNINSDQIYIYADTTAAGIADKYSDQVVFSTSQTSTVDIPGSQISNFDLNPIDDNQGAAFEVLKFIVTDHGVDSTSTFIDGISLIVTGPEVGNDIAWAELKDGVDQHVAYHSSITGTAGTGEIRFGLSVSDNDGDDALDEVLDTDDEEYTVWIHMKTDQPLDAVEFDKYIFSIDEDSILTDGGNCSEMDSADAPVGGVEGQIKICPNTPADQYLKITDTNTPANSTISIGAGEDVPIRLRITDQNHNIDTDDVLPNHQVLFAGLSDAYINGSSITNNVLVTFASGVSITSLDLSVDTMVVKGQLTVTDSGISNYHPLTVTVGAGGIHHFEVTGLLADCPAGVEQSVTVEAQDIFNNTIADYTDQITFSSNADSYSVPGNYTFGGEGVDDGIHTFNVPGDMVILKTIAGNNYYVRVEQVGDPTKSGQQSTNLIPGPLGSFGVIGLTQPDCPAGVVQTVTVTAYDIETNVKTNYTGTIQFSSNAAASDLPGDYAFDGTEAGVYADSVTLRNDAGNSYYVRVEDASDGTKNGQQSTDLIPGAADKLVFNNDVDNKWHDGTPDQWAVSTNLVPNPIVEVRDICDNLINTDNSTVVDLKLSLSDTMLQDETVNLSADSLSLTVNGGKAEFNNVNSTVEYGSGVYLYGQSATVSNDGASDKITFLIDGSTLVNASGSAVTSPVFINTLNHAAMVPVLRFEVEDVGDDTLDTLIDSISVQVSGADVIADIDDAEIEVRDSADNLVGIYPYSSITGTTIAFGQSSILGSADLVKVDNNDFLKFEVRISIDDDELVASDNQGYSFDVIESNISVDTQVGPMSSTRMEQDIEPAATASVVSTVDAIINVDATYLKIEGQASVNAGDSNSLTISYCDAQDNVDLDHDYPSPTGRALHFKGLNSSPDAQSPTINTSPIDPAADVNIDFNQGVAAGVTSVAVEAIASDDLDDNDIALPALTGSLALAVSPDTIDYFELNDPGDIAAGETATYTVTRKDQFGNEVIAGSQDVDLSSDSGGANVAFSPSDQITIPDTSSSQNFGYYDDLAGNYIITASDAGVTGTDSIAVNHAAPDKLVFTQTFISSLNINSNLSPDPVQIEIRDPYENVIDDDNSSSLRLHLSFDNVDPLLPGDEAPGLSVDGGSGNPEIVSAGLVEFNQVQCSQEQTVYLYVEEDGGGTLTPAYSSGAISFEAAATSTVDPVGLPVTDFNLNPLLDEYNERFAVLKFKINDYGQDGVSTKIDQIVIRVGGSAGNAGADIAWAELYDETNGAQRDTATGADITNSTIRFSDPDLAEVTDGNSIDYTINIYMSVPLTAADNLDYTFDIREDDITVDSGITSRMIIIPTDDVATVSATIDVDVSELEFISIIPATATMNNDIVHPLEVEAVDANGNRDLDYNSNITLEARNSGDTAPANGTLSADEPLTQAASSGFVAWSHTKHGQVETIRLKLTSGGLSPEISNDIQIQAAGTSTVNDDNLSVPLTLPISIDPVANEITALEVLKFEVNDLGGDIAPTRIDQIFVQIVNGSSASSDISAAVLNDGVNNHNATNIEDNQITFGSGVNSNNNGDLFEVTESVTVN